MLIKTRVWVVRNVRFFEQFTIMGQQTYGNFSRKGGKPRKYSFFFFQQRYSTGFEDKFGHLYLTVAVVYKNHSSSCCMSSFVVCGKFCRLEVINYGSQITIFEVVNSFPNDKFKTLCNLNI